MPIAVAPDSIQTLPRRLATEPAACCLCQKPLTRTVGSGRDFEYDTSDDVWQMDGCESCDVLVLNPRPSESEFERIYPSNYHAFAFDESKFGFVHRVRRRLEAKRLLFLFRDLPVGASILDVGCGDGFHLDLLREFGPKTWRLTGIDASERAVEHASMRGLNVMCGTLEAQAIPAKSCDAALLIMTIEHVADPSGLLQRIFQVLKPGGRLVVVTDNAASLDAKWFGNRVWGGYHFPRHTYLFTKRTLSQLAINAGLQTHRIRTIVSPVNWVYSIRNWLVDHRWPKWIVDQFSLTKPLPLAAFTVLDNLLRLFGRGALLQGVFMKPREGESK